MKCLKCGYERQAHDDIYIPATECPACGVVYVKAGRPQLQRSRLETTPVLHRSSPVDQASLKKARERVEMRLRQKVLARDRDIRYTQTLERARRIAAQTAQQRQAANHTASAAVSPLKEVDSASAPALTALDVTPSVHIDASRQEAAPAGRSPTQQPAPASKTVPSPVHGAGGALRLAALAAWLILLTGIVGAYLSWSSMAPRSSDSTGIPLGLLLGFAYLATGILGFAFFMLLASFSRRLKEIHRLLLHRRSSADSSADFVKPTVE